MGRQIRIPAPLDPHVHLRGMDWAHKGDFDSETAAALAGGYWAVMDMPNTAPSTVTRASLDRKLAEIAIHARCDWGVYFGASKLGSWPHFSAVIRAVCGLKLYNNATTGDLLIDDQGTRAQHYAHWTSDKPIALHAEGETVPDLLALVRQYGRRTHFLHVSSAEEMGYLRAAKAEGLPITIGVCPHHLWLTQDDLPRLGALGLMKPELKTLADRDALWQALADGLVDVIESDHAPHTLAEKQSDMPPYGVPGLETTLPLLLTAVHEGRLTLDQVVALVAENPRRIWGLGAPPDTYALVDLDAVYTIRDADMHTRAGWTPFDGMTVYGRVVETWIRGRKVYDGERVLAVPGDGRPLYA